MRFLIFISVFFVCTTGWVQESKTSLFKTSEGYAKITSDAPLEIISAESNTLKGILNPAKQTFAFQLEVTSLKGFNSSLQQEHFYENYMETEAYPTAEFSGKIVERIDFNKNGSYPIRAKGILNIHGVKQERIIHCMLNIANQQIIASSDFRVNLSDHNITIPKLVYQKIAEEIIVTIKATLNIIENQE